MLAILRKRRGVVRKKWKIGMLGPITVKIGQEESETRAGIYVWLFGLELVIQL
jgi:hypothetical protein